MKTSLEHVNVTVRDPEATAALLTRLFDWQIRWSGEAKDNGTSIHVGTDDQYVVLYGRDPGAPASPDPGATAAGLNHIGVVVDDLEVAEERVLNEGLVPHNHGDYEPGRRFYFDDPDGVEYEVVSYQ